MKFRHKHTPRLYALPQNNALLSIHRSTIHPVKRLLKASTDLPVRKSFDETGGFIKGYN